MLTIVLYSVVLAEINYMLSHIKKLTKNKRVGLQSFRLYFVSYPQSTVGSFAYDYELLHFCKITLVEQMKKSDVVTAQLKEENQLEWVCRMQNIEARAREVVITELICE